MGVEDTRGKHGDLHPQTQEKLRCTLGIHFQTLARELRYSKRRFVRPGAISCCVMRGYSVQFIGRVGGESSSRARHQWKFMGRITGLKGIRINISKCESTSFELMYSHAIVLQITRVPRCLINSSRVFSLHALVTCHGIHLKARAALLRIRGRGTRLLVRLSAPNGVSHAPLSVAPPLTIYQLLTSALSKFIGLPFANTPRHGGVLRASFTPARTCIVGSKKHSSLGKG